MAVFSICTRGETKGGLYPVYIRISHKSKTEYIRTSYIVNKSGVKRVYNKSGKEKVEISDKQVVKKCLILIDEYLNILNSVTSQEMTVSQIVDLLTKKNDKDMSFVKFTSYYIGKMKNDGKDGNALNYSCALNSFMKFIDVKDVSFSEVSGKAIREWIESMKDSPRKKNLYPVCLKRVFKEGMLYYNDYDKNIIKIPSNPFERVKIPKADTPEKRATEISVLRKLLMYKAEPSPVIGLKELSHDVAMLIFCLAGINAADLYDMRPESLQNWKLCYNRKKTRDKREEKAYIEVEVPELIRPLFEKYKGKKRLFSFCERYSDQRNFCKYVNKGLKKLSEELNLPKITTYTLRHSWATIASNQCNAHDDEVAFALNHASAHTVTRGYIKPDYSKIDKLNQKVIKKVLK